MAAGWSVDEAGTCELSTRQSRVGGGKSQRARHAFGQRKPAKTGGPSHLIRAFASGGTASGGRTADKSASIFDTRDGGKTFRNCLQRLQKQKKSGSKSL